MRKIISLGLLWITVLFSCTDQQRVSPPAQNLTDNLEIQGRPIRVVTTIGMIADLAKNIGGEMVEVTSLMGTGVDPHLYKASAGDVTLVSQADLILYNGLADRSVSSYLFPLGEVCVRERPFHAAVHPIP